MNIEIEKFDNLSKDEQHELKRLLKKATYKSEVFKPKENQNYYFITGDGVVECQGWCGDCYDDANFEVGNCFETEEQAEFTLEKQKVYMQLKRYALGNNKTNINFNISNQAKYYIEMFENDLIVFTTYKIQYYNQIYFTSEEIALNAIAEIGEDRIKKYLFEVED